jgi:hypothetical protein
MFALLVKMKNLFIRKENSFIPPCPYFMKHFNKWLNLRSRFTSAQAGSKKEVVRRFKALPFVGLLVLLLLSNQAIHAQTANPGWQLLTETSGVKAYYMVSTCAAQGFVHFKVVNESSTSQRVMWMGSLENPGAMASSMRTTPPQVLQAGGQVFSDCVNPSQTLSVRLNAAFQLSNLHFKLIVLP